VGRGFPLLPSVFCHVRIQQGTLAWHTEPSSTLILDLSTLRNLRK
jgi:hypothetical protein